MGKKDKTLHPCIDYWGLNDITVKTRNPIPLINPPFEPLCHATVFTKLDLDNAYAYSYQGGGWVEVIPEPYCPSSCNTKHDALSHLYFPDSDLAEPEAILPTPQIVGTATSEIETQVREAQWSDPVGPEL